MRASIWGMTAVGAALIVGAAATLLVRRESAPGPSERPVQPGPQAVVAPRCEIPPLALRPLPHADDPPALVFLDERVRALLDGQPLGNTAAAPPRWRVGTHELALELDARVVSKTRFTVAPFTPVFVQISYVERLGVLALRLGAPCDGCAVPLAPVSLDEDHPDKGVESLYVNAARALRQDDWKAAQRNLRAVPGRSRDALFHTLAAMTFASAGMPDSAKNAARLAARHDPALDQHLASWAAMGQAEAVRARTVPLDRWNALTEHFARLLEHYEANAPSAAARTSERLQGLGDALQAALEAKDTRRATEVLTAATQAVTAWVQELQSTRPHDCEFQKRLSAEANGQD